MLLLEHKAVVNAMNNYGVTPLHEAALQGHLPVAKLLLTKGADVQSKTPAGETPQQIATAGFYFELAAMLKVEADRRAEREPPSNSG